MTAATILSAGQSFGRLRVEAYVGAGRHRCMCECGNVRIVETTKLVIGHSQSCGCLRYSHEVATKTHGLSKTPTYAIWRQMVYRCTNPVNKDFPNYGGRGIKVCDRWLNSVEAFIADMGPCPSGYSIDREEVDGNYEPNNCRWIPMPEQAATRRSAFRKRAQTPEILRLRVAGHTQEDIAEATGVHQATVSRVLATAGLRSRINVGRSWRPA